MLCVFVQVSRGRVMLILEQLQQEQERLHLDLQRLHGSTVDATKLAEDMTASREMHSANSAYETAGTVNTIYSAFEQPLQTRQDKHQHQRHYQK